MRIGRNIAIFAAIVFLAAMVAMPVAAEQPKDPVCGMEVDASKAVKTEYKGKTYYFCSDFCKRKFQKEPAKYVKQEDTQKPPARKS